MTLVRQVPIGPPRTWTFAVQVTGNDPAALWSVNLPGQRYALFGGGLGTHNYTSSVVLQDVLRWEVDPSDTGYALGKQSVRHTRIDAAGNEVAPSFYHVTVDVLCSTFFTSEDVYVITPLAGASLTAFGPDSILLSTVEGPHIASTVGGGGFWSTDHSEAVTHKTILNTYPKTVLDIQIKARRWPSGTPIANLPVTVGQGFVDPHAAAVTSQPFIAYPTVVTDADGNATVSTTNAPAHWPSLWTGGVGFDIGFDPEGLLRARADTRILTTDGVDPTAPYAASFNVPADCIGAFELGRIPGVLTVSRASSYTLAAAGSLGVWQGTARDKNATPGTPDSDSGAWATSNGADGLHASYPAASAHSGRVYGLQHALAAGDGRAVHAFRYLRIKLRSDTPGAATVRLWSDATVASGILTVPNPASPGAFSAGVSVAVGENTWDIDLLNLPAFPWGHSFSGGTDTTQTRGALLDITQDFGLELPLLSGYLDGWGARYYDQLAIDGLTPGANYVLESVALVERSDGGRTPFRVLGSALPVSYVGEAGDTFSTLEPFRILDTPAWPPYAVGDAHNGGDVCTLRCLVNGRPVVRIPYQFARETKLSGTGVEIVTSTPDIPTVADLAQRWRDFYDAGAGVWTLAPAAGDDQMPQHALEVAESSDGGFTCDLVAFSGRLSVAPGYDVTVSPTITLRLDLGGLVEGVLLDDRSHRLGAGKTVRASIQNPPPLDPLTPGLVTEEDHAADADGYWALPDLWQPIYWPPTHDLQQRYGVIEGDSILPYMPPHQLWADDDAPQAGKAQSSAGLAGSPWGVWVAPRSTLFYYDLARLQQALAEQDLAQDLASGRLLHVWSDDTSGALTAEAREGFRGLSGTPARAAAAITDGTTGAVRLGANPSLWITHETGVASLVYSRADGEIVRADSRDGLITLGTESMALFTHTSGYPRHFSDSSTGITYVFCAFDNSDNSQDVRLVRQNALGTLLTWADGTMEKTVIAGTPAAGRPSALLNRFDGVQSLLVLHGDRRLVSSDGGENWTEITT